MKAFTIALVALAQCLAKDVHGLSLRQAADSGIVLYNDRTDQCLSKDAKMWQSCDKAQVFKTPTARFTKLETIDGKKCLGAGEGPQFVVTKCPKASMMLADNLRNDVNYLWEFTGGQLRTRSPFGKMPTCLTNDIGFPFLTDCSQMKFNVAAKPNKPAATSGSSTLKAQIEAAAKTKLPGSTSTHAFMIVNSKNDVIEQYKAGTPVSTMLKECWKLCQIGCYAMEIIVERHVCNLAYQTASPKDLKYEPTGITVFKKPETPTPM